MSDVTILENELIIRSSFFFGMLLFVSIWEFLSPKRKIKRYFPRWLSNLGVSFCNTLLLRVLMAAGGVGFAVTAVSHSWGLFNRVNIGPAISIPISVVILDLAIYFQHLVFHKVPILWRLHRMHHSDTEFDVTTAVRFHPIEILLSMGIKFLVITALGAPPMAVMIFEILLNATAMFNHGNISVPKSIDHFLRYFLVTPDMHRIHHSIFSKETNSNYGFNLPWWDRLFGTYVPNPRDGHIKMVIGLREFRERKDSLIHTLLIQPFVNRRAQ